VSITIRISGSGPSLEVPFLNGLAGHPDATPASSATFDGTHLIRVVRLLRLHSRCHSWRRQTRRYG
jgi:hypothetical protein